MSTEFSEFVPEEPTVEMPKPAPKARVRKAAKKTTSKVKSTTAKATTAAKKRAPKAKKEPVGRFAMPKFDMP